MNLLQSAIKIIQKLQDNGYEAVFTGGYVRDRLLNIQEDSHDIDIATNATPDEVIELFPDYVAVGKQFGIVVVFEDDNEFQIATYRTDGEYIDGRRPTTVEYSSMEEDAKRRDLTINGMFYDPIQKKIYDFVNGQNDLQSKIIRFIGNPKERIAEDKLRMLRALRFAIKFDFTIDDSLLEIIRLHAHQLSCVSKERIIDEFVKTLRLRKPRRFLELLFKTNLIEFIFPDVKNLKGLQQPKEHHPEGDVLEHTIQVLENLPEDASDELLMAGLLHDIGKVKTVTYENDRIHFHGHDKVGSEMVKNLLSSYNCSWRFINAVSLLVLDHMKFINVQNMKKSTLKKLIRQDNFDDLLQLHKADRLGSSKRLDDFDYAINKQKEFQNELTPPRLLTGKDLIHLGIPVGPEIGKLLKEIENLQLEGILNTTEEAVEYLHR